MLAALASGFNMTWPDAYSRADSLRQTINIAPKAHRHGILLRTPMELRQLRAVIAIAETGSVSKAAERLHIVQPALSRQLRLLEHELGKPIFERSHVGMRLTSDGSALLQAARRAISTLDQTLEEIRPKHGVVCGVVSVGLLPSSCDLLAGALVSAVRSAYPQVKLRLRVGMAGELQAWVEEGKLDVALLYSAREGPSVEVHPLLDEPLFLVGPPAPDAGCTDFEHLATLSNLPLILPTRMHSVREILEKACTLAKVPLNVVIEADDVPLTKALVTSGIGYSVLAGIAVAEEILANRLLAVPLGDPPLQRRVALVRSKADSASPISAQIAEVIEARIKTVVRQNRWPGARLVEFELSPKRHVDS